MPKAKPKTKSPSSDAPRFRDGPLMPLLMLALPLLAWLSDTDLDDLQTVHMLVPMTLLVLLLAYGILWPGKHRWARRIALAGMGLGMFAMMVWVYTNLDEAIASGQITQLMAIGSLLVAASFALLGLYYCVTGRVPFFDGWDELGL